MSICPGCGYKLTHLSGAPRGLHGAFEAEVRCPECAQVVAPGTRVLVGSVTPHQVGARMQLGWIAGFGVLALFFALSAAKQVRALSAMIGSGDLNGLLPLLDPSLLGCGFMIFWIARGTLTRRKHRQPEDITRAIAAKSLWIVAPGAIEVMHGPVDASRADAGGGAFGAIMRKFANERIASERIRSIAAIEVPARRGVAGRVVHLTMRLADGTGAAGSMYVVTSTPAARLAAELTELLRSPAPGAAATPAAPASPGAHAGGTIEVDAIEVEADRVTIRGSPFEPRLLREMNWSHRRPWLRALVAVGLIVGGVMLLRNGQGRSAGLGLLMNVFGVGTFVTILYTRYRASPARWIATPGMLRIERFTRLMSWFGPSVRSVRAERLLAIRVSERDGLPVLEAWRKGSSRPAGILTPDDLGRREPAEVAAAIEAIVRRPAS